MKHIAALLLALLALQPALAQTSVRIVSVDSARIGGLYDFQFPVRDETKLREQFGGHEIEFRFEPVWRASQWPPMPGTPYYGVYDRRIVVYDRTTDSTLAEYPLIINEHPCDPAFNIYLSEHAGIFLDDPYQPVDPSSREVWPVAGRFTTDKDCYEDNRFIGEAFSFAFNYAFEQWGGVLRTDTIIHTQGDANTILAVGRQGIQTVDAVFKNNQGFWTGFNNGPAAYEVEFLPGGVEPMFLRFGKKDNIRVEKFNVPYLNVRMRNTVSYERPAPGGGTATVAYPGEVAHYAVTDLDSNMTPWPDAADVPQDVFNLSAYAWVNGRTLDNLVQHRPQQAAGPGLIENSQNRGMPVGTQGRYYLSVIDEGDTVDFTHVLIASGAEFILDFANKRGRRATPPQWNRSPVQPIVDFEPGDKVQFSLFGGAVGLPMSNTRVVVHIDTIATDIADTELLPGGVSVAPNPSGDNTTIRYTLAAPAQVTLTVVDELGRTVAVLAEGHRQAGVHSATLRAGELKSGWYFYRLNTGGALTTGTIVVLH